NGWTWGPTTEYQRAAALSLARGASGEYYVGGTFRGPNIDFDPGPGQQLRTPNHRTDGYLLRLTSAGAFEWVDHWMPGFAGDGDSGRDIVVDTQNNPVVVGTTGPNDTQATARKYSPSGGLQWNRDWGGVDFDGANGIDTIDGTSLVITGWFEVTSDFGFGSGSDVRSTVSGASDFFLVRLQPDGTR
ncbi:MAG TPA: hypothetical protein VEI97_13965, partial [bacterium]|nr:hypothetical protein [bacterium]